MGIVMTVFAQERANQQPMNPNDLAKCQRQIATWTAKRDRLVCEALDEGYSLRAVAEAAGLTHTAIAKIRDRKLVDPKERRAV